MIRFICNPHTHWVSMSPPLPHNFNYFPARGSIIFFDGIALSHFESTRFIQPTISSVFSPCLYITWFGQLSELYALLYTYMYMWGILGYIVENCMDIIRPDFFKLWVKSMVVWIQKCCQADNRVHTARHDHNSRTFPGLSRTTKTNFPGHFTASTKQIL